MVRIAWREGDLRLSLLAWDLLSTQGKDVAFRENPGCMLPLSVFCHDKEMSHV